MKSLILPSSETFMWSHIYTREYKLVNDTSNECSEVPLSRLHPLVALLNLICTSLQQKAPKISNLPPFCIYTQNTGSLSARVFVFDIIDMATW